MSMAASEPERTSYLEAYLAPFVPMLARPDVTDIFVNRPGEIWIETQDGAIERIAMPELDETRLWRLARQIASLSHQGISREHPLLAASLPDGSRVQIVAPPATRGPMALAIRKHVVSDMSLADYGESGAFDDAVIAPMGAAGRADDLLQTLGGDPVRLLAQAVRERRNIVISGGTSSGKTTFLNALLKEVPPHERLIIIEDTPELRLTHENALGLLAVKGDQGEARVTTNDLLQASLRMRPDRIILGELRGAEAYSFLRAVNTGHPGSLTTLHADSPQGAIEQLALIVLQSGVHLRREDVIHYVRNVVDLWVQLERRDGKRRVAKVVTMDRSGTAIPVIQ